MAQATATKPAKASKHVTRTTTADEQNAVRRAKKASAKAGPKKPAGTTTKPPVRRQPLVQSALVQAVKANDERKRLAAVAAKKADDARNTRIEQAGIALTLVEAGESGLAKGSPAEKVLRRILELMQSGITQSTAIAETRNQYAKYTDGVKNLAVSKYFVLWQVAYKQLEQERALARLNRFHNGASE